jgi:hypothetical protein
MERIPSRNEIMNKLAADQTSQIVAARNKIAVKLSQAATFPVRFTLEEFGNNPVVRHEIDKQLKQLGWAVHLQEVTDEGKTVQFYEVN